MVKDKCSNCGDTKSKMFYDFPDGTFLCEKCDKTLGDGWLNKHSGKKVSSWIKVASYVFLGIWVIPLVISFLVNLGISNLELIAIQGMMISKLSIGGMMSIICANQCSKWASENKKSENFAYIFGFALSIVGLILFILLTK